MSAVTRNPWKPKVAQDYDGWAVLLDGRWRVVGTWEQALDAAFDRCDQFRPGCGRKDCPCRRPGPVCSFDQKLLVGDRFCPRCGWSRRLHTEGMP